MIKPNTVREVVLYYNPNPSPHIAKLKSVLVRMGVRIKNVAPDQVTELVGVLLGGNGVEQKEKRGAESSGEFPVIPDEMLVLHNFAGRRLDELLLNLRKAGVPKIALKAMVTEHNIHWSFYRLYEELREEHETMNRGEK